MRTWCENVCQCSWRVRQVPNLKSRSRHDQRSALCRSGLVAAAIEGQDALELLSVSVRIGRNCGRTKGTLAKLGTFAHPQARTCQRSPSVCRQIQV